MLFFVYARDAAGAGAKRRALLPPHWDFMTPHIPAMVARGPTVTEANDAVTGSLHIVDLRDCAAAARFVADDPLMRGGVFADVRTWRFANLLDRTMWAFSGEANHPRFLVIAPARSADDSAARGADASVADASVEDVTRRQAAWAREPAQASHVIVIGPLLGDDGTSWQGTALLLEAPDAAAAEAVLRSEPATASGLHGEAEWHRWRFGGAENLRDLVAPR
ncbi:hypothetical protein A33M_3272 [Rhodovulum sp. PH10]|uniref:YciI family protein n=1 Tax=Rhodovulum sp. PH10 TaxID=1187851 RepID=UPI00027C2699|nr:YciI family protein [Rhodovulum sp. PH10]EJW11306.1 hypothetical protein A33M_3272 [Rhodovulum sp. PH10]